MLSGKRPPFPALRYLFAAPPIWVFAAGALATNVLADWTRRATEAMAGRAGSMIDGPLYLSFGNTAELVLALFVLSKAKVQVVQAQIAGSMIAPLFFLDISILVGGIGRTRQKFDRAYVGLLSSLLLLMVVAIPRPGDLRSDRTRCRARSRSR